MTYVCGLLLFLPTPRPARCDVTAAAPAAAVDQQLDAYAAQLTELAEWCEAHDAPQTAQAVRRWSPPRDPWRMYLAPWPGATTNEPSQTAAPAEHFPKKDTSAAEAASAEAAAQQRFDDVRRVQAEKLFELAQAAAKEKHASLAIQLVYRTLREDPEHAAARRILGFEKYENAWRTPFEVSKRKAGYVWHERFGWLPAAHVPRYEAGQRYVKGAWRTAEEEARREGNIDRGWDIYTEHYYVRTSAGLEAGVALAARLERLHAVWRQLFVDHYLPPARLARQFAGAPPSRQFPKRHHVVYFHDREEYQRELARIEPRIALTTGYYAGDKRKAYFYAGGDGDDHSNLYHEATHQLFSELKQVVPDIEDEANFWVVEGIACYLESLAEAGDWMAVGGADAVRMSDARYRLLEDDFYVPLETFAAIGRTELQQDERLAMLYSQASGLTHFLMHYEAGRYRDALVAYLGDVYAGRAGPRALAERTGTSFVDLDRQYREFCTATAAAAPEPTPSAGDATPAAGEE